MVVVDCADLRIGTVVETYGYDCPECGAEVICAANARTIKVLGQSGCLAPIMWADVDVFVDELGRLPTAVR